MYARCLSIRRVHAGSFVLLDLGFVISSRLGADRRWFGVFEFLLRSTLENSK